MWQQHSTLMDSFPASSMTQTFHIASQLQPCIFIVTNTLSISAVTFSFPDSNSGTFHGHVQGSCHKLLPRVALPQSHYLPQSPAKKGEGGLVGWGLLVFYSRTYTKCLK